VGRSNPFCGSFRWPQVRKLVENAVQNPTDVRFRTIKTSNPKIRACASLSVPPLSTHARQRCVSGTHIHAWLLCAAQRVPQRENRGRSKARTAPHSAVRAAAQLRRAASAIACAPRGHVPCCARSAIYDNEGAALMRAVGFADADGDGDAATLSDSVSADALQVGPACARGLEPPTQGTLWYSVVLWGTLGYSGVLWGTLGYSGVPAGSSRLRSTLTRPRRTAPWHTPLCLRNR
jgi:hypothetical protein